MSALAQHAWQDYGILLVDLVYAGSAVLSEAGNFSIVAAVLRTLVTAIYLVGLPERRVSAVGAWVNRTLMI